MNIIGKIKAAAVAIGKLLRAVSGWLPLTLLGLTVASAAGLYLGAVVRWQMSEDRVALAAAGCVLFLSATAVALVFVTGLWLRLWTCRGRQEALRLEGGVPCRTGYDLGWAHWNPLLKIDLGWEEPADVAVRVLSYRRRLVEEVTAEARAWRGDVIRRITVQDVLGLARVTFRVRYAQPVEILPRCSPVGELAMLAQYAPGEGLGHPEGKPVGDLLETREYGPGDPLKLVLWKQFARTGQMLVRLPERSVAPINRVLAYLVAGEADEPSAGVARALLETGRLGGDFLFGADGSAVTTQTVPAAREQIVQSANFRSAGGEGLATFLDRGKARGATVALVFVPCRPGAWLNKVIAGISRFGGACHVIVGVDELTVARPGKKLSRLLFSGDSKRDSRAGLQRVISQLQRVTARVTVVNRMDGKVVSV
jgi:hypothetical protein